MKTEIWITPKEWEKIIPSLGHLSEQSREIAFTVLVERKKQAGLCEKYRITKADISQIVRKVYAIYQNSIIPPGYERVNVILPKYKAFTVKKWGKEAVNEICVLSQGFDPNFSR